MNCPIINFWNKQTVLKRNFFLSSCVWGCNKCGMPNYSSSLLSSYSDTEHSSRFPPINTDNFPGPQFPSPPQREKTEGQLHVDGSPGTNSNTTPNHVPDFPHSRKHDQIRVCTINFCSLISHDKQLQLHQVTETYKPDVILGCETHLELELPTARTLAGFHLQAETAAS